MYNSVDIFYSVLKYIPSEVRMESINVGLAIHIPSQSYSHLFITTNKRRVAAFDDEYDKDFFNMVMDSLSYDINYEVNDLNVNAQRSELIKSDIFLETVTGYLANEFQFSPVTLIKSNLADLKRDAEDLKDIFLHYDKPKENRITTAQMQRLLSKQMKSCSYNVEKKPKVTNEFGNANYDYKINGNTLVRAISFDYKKENALVTGLKTIMYDLEHLHCSEINKVILVCNNNLDTISDRNRQLYYKFRKIISETENISVKVVPLEELNANI